MLYRKNQNPKLERELFANPSSEYRGTPFWSWNCRVTKELIADQMEVFRRMGFGGAHLHPRTGLETPYMGEEFLSLIRYADDQAKNKDMLCWLYDEDRYPSGAAGGIVTENPEFRARHLLLTRERKKGMCESREAYEACLACGEKPAGYYLTAYRILTKNGYMLSYRQIEGEQPRYDSREENEREGRLWFAYVELMRESPWFNDQTYVDVMNQKAVRRFIEVTHEKYYRELGEEFGRSVPAIFTDEPQIKGSMALADGETEADVTLSFTDDLPDTYKQTYGVSLLAVLPELLWEKSDGSVSVHRLQYHDHLAERFVSAFSDTIAEWCEAHGIAMTGHYMSEPTLYSQTLRLGEAMRCYRKQQLPGVDILCGDPEYSTVKQAVSVARQYGREGVLSELYGVNHWDFDFKGHKLQGDWQAALGVTIRVPHLAFMSMEGEAKRDWPASLSYQSPWWDRYSYVEDYFARINTVLTRGKAKPCVAVVHPIESYWLYYGPVAQTGGIREQMDTGFKQLIDWLLFGLIDFDFLSESLLTEQGTFVTGGNEEGSGAANSTEGAALQVGQMAYHTVLVPDLKTIRSSTLAYLEELVKAGGRVIFLGGIPEFADGRKSDRPARLAARAEVIPFRQQELLSSLQRERFLEIRRENGSRSDNLFYQLRQDGKDQWLFVCHVNRKRNRVDQAERVEIQLRGEYEIISYNALNGEIEPLSSRCRDGWTSRYMDLHSEDSFLWKLSERVEEQCGTEVNAEDNTDQTAFFPVKEGERIPVYGLVAGSFGSHGKPRELLAIVEEPDAFSLAEPNVLLLDQAEWKLDGFEFHPRMEILRLDNEIRTIVGYPHRQDAYTQPWRIPEAPKEHAVVLRYEIESKIDTGSLKLAMERPQDAVIWWNGEICSSESNGWYVDRFIQTVEVPGLRTGKNELVLEIPYGRKTNLENIFLLGEFGVEVWGTKAVVTEAADKVYFGDITRQRMPFYGGSITYRMDFSMEAGREAVIRVPHFAAPVLEVTLDGKKRGLIAYAPHELPVGELSAGRHTLEICVLGNRFNTFGTLHNCNDEYKWYGPDSYRTKGSEWSETWCLRPFGILSRVEILSGSDAIY